MRLVIAIGGNALQNEKEEFTWDGLVNKINLACLALGDIAQTNELVITHGNGPQIGLVAQKIETAFNGNISFSLDVLSSVFQGAIGYAFMQGLRNSNPNHKIACILTQIEIDPNDAAMQYPEKSIGPLYTLDQCKQHKKKLNWTFKKEGNYFRRVVPSPKPLHVVEIDAIKKLIDKRSIVIAGGSGGMPIAKINHQYKGVDAVIDKDLTSALIAYELNADFLLIATSASAIWENWGAAQPKAIKCAHPDALLAFNFECNAIKTKVKAACDFVYRTQKTAAIGSLENIGAIFNKQSGTFISTNCKEIVYYE